MDHHSDEVEVRVLQHGGPFGTFNVPANMNVRKLKRHIQDEKHIPINRQRLMIGETRLKGGESLVTLSEGASELELFLVVRSPSRRSEASPRPSPSTSRPVFRRPARRAASPSPSPSTSSGEWAERREASQAIEEAEARGISPSAYRPDLFYRKLPNGAIDWANPPSGIRSRPVRSRSRSRRRWSGRR